MFQSRMVLIGLALGFSATQVFAAAPAPATTAVLADTLLLRELGAKILATQPDADVSYARLTADQQLQLTALAHEHGKCGGFEALPSDSHAFTVTEAFGQLASREAKRRHYVPQSQLFTSMTERQSVTAAVQQVSAANLKSTVEFMSAFPDRFNQGSTPNTSVEALKSRIEATVKGARNAVVVELISHHSTSQKSIRARIVGTRAPNEIVVLGGHLDSINHEWFGNGVAPGADDNASGSSNILEALRIVANQPAPERTIEFFWYAGEESGLLGSAEIAADYKKQNKDVIGVLQLDMTLFPGAGEFVLGSMTDFTSPWMRQYLENLNGLYIHAKIVNDKCGYGCSDHASWDKQGYPALMPFESTFDGMNQNLHTSKDLIDGQSNFEHSAMFAKFATAIAMDLANSTLREP